MKNKEIELLPCPFCGHIPQYAISNIMATIECCNDVCGAQTVYVQKKNMKTAFKSWNTRPKSPESSGLVALDEEKCDCCHRPIDEQFKKTGIFKEHKSLPELSKIIEAGKGCGYAIVCHGSMTRDIDLIAVPWIETAVSPEELIRNICSVNPLKFFKEPHQNITEKYFGRLCQVISVAGENTYIDLSICSKFGAPSIPSVTDLENLILSHTKGMTERQYGSGKHYAYICREDLARAIHNLINNGK